MVRVGDGVGRAEGEARCGPKDGHEGFVYVAKLAEQAKCYDSTIPPRLPLIRLLFPIVKKDEFFSCFFPFGVAEMMESMKNVARLNVEPMVVEDDFFSFLFFPP